MDPIANETKPTRQNIHSTATGTYGGEGYPALATPAGDRIEGSATPVARRTHGDVRDTDGGDGHRE